MEPTKPAILYEYDQSPQYLYDKNPQFHGRCEGGNTHAIVTVPSSFEDCTEMLSFQHAEEKADNHYVTGFVKNVHIIVHTSNFSTLVAYKIYILGVLDGCETFRDCRTTIPLIALKISTLCIIH